MTAITRALSAALLHFVWQGLLVTILVWLALFLLRKRTPPLRYAVSGAALALIVALPAVTAWISYEHPAAAMGDVTLTLSASAVESAESSAARFEWFAWAQAWAVPVWSFGVLLFSVRMAWGCMQITGLRRAGESCSPELLSTL